MAGEGLQKSYDFLLDTGVVIRHLRNDKRAHDLLDSLEKLGNIRVSTITYMEILVKCRPHEEEITRILFERVPQLTVSQEIAEKSALLIRKYKSVFDKDNIRQFPDAIIAATAWQQQGALVTLNKKQFAKAPINEFTVQVIDQEAEDWINQLKL